MNHKHSHKTAIITGSSRGIGRAVALRLAHEGYSIVVNYVGRQVQADGVVNEILELGKHAIAVRADVSKKADAMYLFEEAEKAFGQVDVLVNNAGILQMLPLATASEDDFDHIFAVNVRGTFNTMQQAALRMRDGGHIINFSTSVIALALPSYGPYAASKAAVEQLTRVMANELRGRRITVNAVAPGPVATELFLEGKSEAQIQYFAKLPPLERLGEPDDIANIVAFLASEEGSWINGQTLRANGGYC